MLAFFQCLTLSGTWNGSLWYMLVVLLCNFQYRQHDEKTGSYNFEGGMFPCIFVFLLYVNARTSTIKTNAPFFRFDFQPFNNFPVIIRFFGFFDWNCSMISFKIGITVDFLIFRGSNSRRTRNPATKTPKCKSCPRWGKCRGRQNSPCGSLPGGRPIWCGWTSSTWRGTCTTISTTAKMATTANTTCMYVKHWWYMLVGCVTSSVTSSTDENTKKRRARIPLNVAVMYFFSSVFYVQSYIQGRIGSILTRVSIVLIFQKKCYSLVLADFYPFFSVKIGSTGYINVQVLRNDTFTRQARALRQKDQLVGDMYRQTVKALFPEGR